jgi:dihydrofolate reductase
MPLSLIVAVDKQNGIGQEGKIPWYIPEDMAYFRRTTLYSTIVMGRQTFVSIGLRPLANRKNIVVTSFDLHKENITFLNINDTREYIEENRDNENIFIIGGENLYKEFNDECDYLYITYIHKSFECDRHFVFDINNFNLISKSEVMKSSIENIEYQFHVYQRIK